MIYMNDKVERFKKGRFEDYTGKNTTPNPILWELVNELDDATTRFPNVRESMFVYYERYATLGDILALRIPNLDTHIVFKCSNYKKRDREKMIVKLEDLDGPYSDVLFAMIARKIPEFFQETSEYYRGKNPDKVDVCVVDVATKKCRCRVSALEPETVQMMMRPVRNKTHQ